MVSFSSLFLRGDLRLVPRAAFALLIAFAMGSAQAAEPEAKCPAYTQLIPIEKLSSAKLRELNQLFSTVPEACLDESDFLEQRVRVALALGDITTAAIWAERRAMIDPESPAALMDYAWTARLSGQDFLARELITQVLERPDIPPGLRSQLIAWMDTPIKPQLRFLRGRTVVGASFGYESNLNNRPRNGEVALTFPTGDYVFQLDPSELARSGAVLTSYGQWASKIARGIEPIGDIRIVGQARQPMVGGSAFSTQAAEAHLGFDTQAIGLSPGGLPDRLWASIGQYGYGGRALLAAQSLGGSWVFEHGRPQGLSGLLSLGTRCASSPGFWLEGRRFNENPTNNSDIVGANYSFGCRNFDVRYGFDLFSLKDQARGGRLGGDIQRSGLTLSMQSARPYRELFGAWLPDFMAAGINWLGYLRLDRARDQEGYSDLLDFGSRRWMNGQTLGLQISAEMPKSGLTLFGRFERKLQKSNIAFFALESSLFSLGAEFRVD